MSTSNRMEAILKARQTGGSPKLASIYAGWHRAPTDSAILDSAQSSRSARPITAASTSMSSRHRTCRAPNGASSSPSPTRTCRGGHAARPVSDAVGLLWEAELGVGRKCQALSPATWHQALPGLREKSLMTGVGRAFAPVVGQDGRSSGYWVEPTRGGLPLWVMSSCSVSRWPICRIWVDEESFPGKNGGNYEFFDPWTGQDMPDEYWSDESD
ncbi:hypothetical protein BDW68DRAFT_183229 [Aspergillus falconensis]